MFYKLKYTALTTLITLSSIFAFEAICIGDDTMGYEEDVVHIQNDTTRYFWEGYEEVFNFVVPDGIGTGTFTVPLSGTFTSGYGQRWGRLHGGIDIAAKTGTPITASDDGKVIFTGDCGSYGLLVKIDHQNGYVTYYAHCSKISVSVGDYVQKGDIISYVGNTGNSTGPHCHFEVRYNNERKNPLDYVVI